MVKLVMFCLVLVILAPLASSSSLIYQDGRPNLLIGGILQENPEIENSNCRYKDIADQINATYIVTYYSGSIAIDASEVNDAASCAKSHVPTLQNGLSNPKLSGGDDTYNTIVAYSGGTTSAVTALDKQGVRCHTLILISPMIGMVPATTGWYYEQQIRRILENGSAERIVVIQSPDDLPFAELAFQAYFTEGNIPGVDVYNVDFENNGIKNHEDFFFSYAKDHLNLGTNGRVYYVPGRILDWINIKRNEIHLSGVDKYGHYWIEILDGPDGDPVESYGWWPKYPLNSDLTGVINTLVGVQGELNGITSFGGSETRDPHHGTTAETEFHPILMNELTNEQVLDKIHEFVRDYRGEWRWTFGGGQNCQTFQTDLMNYVGLAEPSVKTYSSTEATSWSEKGEMKQSLKKIQKI